MLQNRTRLLLLLTALGGCASMSSTMEKWVGQKDSDLISSYGPPERSTRLDDGSHVMVWSKDWTDPAGTLKRCDQIFTADRAGIVRKWSTQNCPSHYFKT
jgi:hypothetical protein